MESGGEPATQSWEAERMVGRLRRRADLRLDGGYRARLSRPSLHHLLLMRR